MSRRKKLLHARSYQPWCPRLSRLAQGMEDALTRTPPATWSRPSDFEAGEVVRVTDSKGEVTLFHVDSTSGVPTTATRLRKTKVREWVKPRRKS